MKVCIVSTHFSPASVSHMMGYAKLFANAGAEVLFLLDKKYTSFKEIKELSNVFHNLRELPKIDLLFIVNPSPNHHRIARKVKNNGVKILYLYHEPYDSLKNYLKEGVKQTAKTFLVHYFSVLTLKNSDVVIVPSEYALELYKRSDIRHCKSVYKIPLIFDDELEDIVRVENKKYFSFVGHAVKGHAFDYFLQFIEYMNRKKSDIQFQIVTRTDISNYLKRYKFLLEMAASGKLRLVHGRVLTNEEINKAYETSFCVWNIYNRSTQSGVLPKAFMFGTPVIANNTGSFPEFVKNGYNGFLVDLDDKTYSLGIIEEKTREIISKIEEMSRNARETFLKLFYYKAHVESFAKLI